MTPLDQKPLLNQALNPIVAFFLIVAHQMCYAVVISAELHKCILHITLQMPQGF